MTTTTTSATTGGCSAVPHCQVSLESQTDCHISGSAAFHDLNGHETHAVWCQNPLGNFTEQHSS